MSDFARRLLNLPEQASTFAPEIDALHYTVISITMLGATGVFVTALWFTVRYRRREPEQTIPIRRGAGKGQNVARGRVGTTRCRASIRPAEEPSATRRGWAARAPRIERPPVA